AEDSRGTQLHRALRKTTKLSLSIRCKGPGASCIRIAYNCCKYSCRNGKCS
nr:RecName: Full=Conotoxin Bu13; Flags: Precursor [Conus bullatus]